MLVYAGIDEAGYGPIFGPLVVARTVFVLEEEAAAGELPSLWRLLQGAVCRNITDKKRRVAVNDSKALYTPALGLRHLERGVLGFLSSAGVRSDRLDALLEGLAFDPDSRGSDKPWYRDVGNGPDVPFQLAREELERVRGRIDRASRKAALRLSEACTAVVFEDRFNRIVADTRSKSTCAWAFVGGHLRAVWDRYGDQNPRVVIDRQGGRRYYADALRTFFPEARIEPEVESAPLSLYHLTEGDRSMKVTVQVGSEEHHFPVALASMTAKYVRELLLTRFQAFWKTRAPHVRPTFGYFGDGRRFLREIQPTLDRLGIDPAHLVRCC